MRSGAKRLRVVDVGRVATQETACGQHAPIVDARLHQQSRAADRAPRPTRSRSRRHPRAASNHAAFAGDRDWHRVRVRHAVEVVRMPAAIGNSAPKIACIQYPRAQRCRATIKAPRLPRARPANPPQITTAIPPRYTRPDVENAPNRHPRASERPSPDFCQRLRHCTRRPCDAHAHHLQWSLGRGDGLDGCDRSCRRSRRNLHRRASRRSNRARGAAGGVSGSARPRAGHRDRARASRA